MKTIYHYFLLLLAFLASCEKDADNAPKSNDECGPAIQIVDVITTVEDDDFAILSVAEEDLCLTVTIAATGCGSDNWTLDLLTFGEVAESLPTQTSAFFRFDDGIESGSFTCQAEIQATYSFDLTPYLADALPTILRLSDTVEEVTIEE